jgi:hypothetical protein
MTAVADEVGAPRGGGDQTDRHRTEGNSSTARTTLVVVVCVTTVMLMLDIAVVNTALTRIAADLPTGTLTRKKSAGRRSPG